MVKFAGELDVPDLSGRTAIVTGATGGIGLWTAIGLAQAGAHVVLVGRDTGRLEAAKRIVASKSGRAPAETILADFASLKAVDSLAGSLLERHPRLDILVNNAGLFSPKRELTVDGYERTFAVNHLAPFLLTTRLLPALETAGRPGKSSRIVTLSSAAAKGASIDFDDLMAAKSYNMLGAYSRSKLANLMFTKELARRLAQQPVTANCLHPGVVATDIASKGGIMGAVWGVMKPFMLTPEKGAMNSMFVATSPSIEGVSGEYFAKQKAQSVNRLAEDANAVARLWSESERLVAAALAKS